MPEFDLIAPVYDTTRRPPSEAELAAVVAALDGERSILEIGVGTGRFAGPLTERGFEITGVDISREMIRRAREKGLRRLLLADLHRLPFPPKSFDAAIMIHVLQLLPDPTRALAAMAQVAEQRVVAVNPDRSSEREGVPGFPRFRERYRELAAEMGYPLPPRLRYWENMEKLLKLHPPTKLSTVEEEVPFDPDRAKAWRDMRAFGGLIQVPPEVHERIVERLRAELPPNSAGPRSPRRRRLNVATWDAAGLRAAFAASPIAPG